MSDCSTCSTSGSFGAPTFAGDFSDWHIYDTATAGDLWAVRRSIGGWSSMQGQSLARVFDVALPLTRTLDSRNIREATTSSYSNEPTSETDSGSRYSPKIQAASGYDDKTVYRAPTPEAPVDDYWQHLDDRDRLLVQWKLNGMSYRDIKARGGFTEAESTLRGRFRALTKEPDQRVRKPRWTRRDVCYFSTIRSNVLTISLDQAPPRSSCQTQHAYP